MGGAGKVGVVANGGRQLHARFGHGDQQPVAPGSHVVRTIHSQQVREPPSQGRDHRTIERHQRVHPVPGAGRGRRRGPDEPADGARSSDGLGPATAALGPVASGWSGRREIPGRPAVGPHGRSEHGAAGRHWRLHRLFLLHPSHDAHGRGDRSARLPAPARRLPWPRQFAARLRRRGQPAARAGRRKRRAPGLRP